MAMKFVLVLALVHLIVSSPGPRPEPNPDISIQVQQEVELGPGCCSCGCGDCCKATEPCPRITGPGTVTDEDQFQRIGGCCYCHCEDNETWWTAREKCRDKTRYLPAGYVADLAEVGGPHCNEAIFLEAVGERGVGMWIGTEPLPSPVVEGVPVVEDCPMLIPDPIVGAALTYMNCSIPNYYVCQIYGP